MTLNKTCPDSCPSLLTAYPGYQTPNPHPREGELLNIHPVGDSTQRDLHQSLTEHPLRPILKTWPTTPESPSIIFPQTFDSFVVELICDLMITWYHLGITQAYGMRSLSLQYSVLMDIILNYLATLSISNPMVVWDRAYACVFGDSCTGISGGHLGQLYLLMPTNFRVRTDHQG